MSCNNQCEQGRRCDCSDVDDLYALEVWMVWLSGACLTMLLTAVTFAVGGFLWGMFA